VVTGVVVLRKLMPIAVCLVLLGGLALPATAAKPKDGVFVGKEHGEYNVRLEVDEGKLSFVEIQWIGEHATVYTTKPIAIRRSGRFAYEGSASLVGLGISGTKKTQLTLRGKFETKKRVAGSYTLEDGDTVQFAAARKR
jgi:hypothetical protein